MSFLKWFSKKDPSPEAPQKQEAPVQKKQIPNRNFTSSTQKPPSKKQIEECQLLGIKIAPNANSRGIWELVEKAKITPPTKEIWEEHCRLKREQEYENHLEDYTDEFGAQVAETVIGEYRRWSEDSLEGGGCQRVVVFKRGKTVSVDVIELERVELEETSAGKPFVALSFLRPKIYKGKADESPWIEWEKEFNLKSHQVLEHHRLDVPIDMFDIDHYEKVISDAQSFVNKITGT